MTKNDKRTPKRKAQSSQWIRAGQKHNPASPQPVVNIFSVKLEVVRSKKDFRVLYKVFTNHNVKAPRLGKLA